MSAPDRAASGEPKPTALYAVLFNLLRMVLGSAFRLRYLHHDRLPASGPIIVASNHVSNVDPFMVAFAFPTRRPVHYMAKEEMFRNPLAKRFFETVHVIAVKRGAADRAAIRATADVLKAGGVVGVFPHGTRVRGGKVPEVHDGASFLALMTGATIVPCGIAGTDEIVPEGARFPRFPQVTVSIGEPIDVAAYASLAKAERVAALTATTMSEIESARVEAARSRVEG